MTTEPDEPPVSIGRRSFMRRLVGALGGFVVGGRLLLTADPASADPCMNVYCFDDGELCDPGTCTIWHFDSCHDQITGQYCFTNAINTGVPCH